MIVYLEVSIHKTPARRYLLVMKGAPEKILTCCSTVFINGAEIEINKNVKESFKQVGLAIFDELIHP